MFGRLTKIINPVSKSLRNFDFKTPESLEAFFAATRLSSNAKQIAAAAKASFGYSASVDPAGLGQSKLGGLPDLPDGWEWPLRPSLGVEKTEYMNEQQFEFLNSIQPLSFIGQFNLSEMSNEISSEIDLPSHGIIYVFYDAEHMGWGFDPKDGLGTRILFAEDVSRLVSCPSPSEHELLRPFSEVSLRGEARLDPPPSEGIHFDALGLSEKQADLYLDLKFEMTEGEIGKEQVDLHWGGKHKLGGWPDLIQNPMEQECALVSAGMYCGDSGAYNSPEGKAILAKQNDWRLLLQIDTDDAAEMMWGDVGTLYIWIKQGDLENRDFNNCWLILQCG